jgi:putative transposase
VQARQQQTLRRLSDAFAAFYDRCKAAGRNGRKKPGYPRFEAYSRFGQVRFVNGDGAKWIPAEAGGWARATFQAVGSVKVRQHRRVPGTVTALQLKREHRRWYVIVITETEPAPPPATGREVGVDVGGARCARPRQDTVICLACGPHDADVNGARNIASRAGLGSGQAAPAA